MPGSYRDSAAFKRSERRGAEGQKVFPLPFVEKPDAGKARRPLLVGAAVCAVAAVAMVVADRRVTRKVRG